MEETNRYEVTGIPMWKCLQALYEGCPVQTEYNLSVPAQLADFIGTMQGQPSESSYKEGLLQNGSLPDYFRGRPIKVTTEYYKEDLSRTIKELGTRIFIGRLDLYDRDNGGPGTALKILQELSVKTL